MRTLFIAVAALATALAGAAQAGSSREAGLNLSFADQVLASNATARTKPLVLNGLPNIRSTGTVGLIGFQPIDGLSIEADLNSRRTDSSLSDIARSGSFGGLGQSRNGSLESVGTGVSLVHRLDTEGPLQPYLIGGLGATRLTESRGLGDRTLRLTNRVAFDFQLGAGLAVNLSERVMLATGYRFVSNIGTVSGFEGSSSEARKRDTSSHILGVSVRVPFGEVD